MLVPPLHNEDIPYGHRVLLRSSLNVPISRGEVAGTFRLQESLRSMEYLRQRKARVTVISHLSNDDASLAPIHRKLNEHLPIAFIPKIIGEEVYKARKQLQPGDLLLLENTRTHPGEKTNDYLFTEEVGSQTDLFVFDDFSAAHREHTSTTGLITALPSCAGTRFYEELTGLLRITDRLVSPSLAIVGGAKCETKIPLLKNLLKMYDTIFVAGVTANTILKQRGFPVGASVVEEVAIPPEILENHRIVTPPDALVLRKNREVISVPVTDLQKDDVIVDIGDTSLKTLHHYLETIKTIVMNGPLGWYEKGFSRQTIALSHLVNESDTYSFIGGGDSTTLLEQHDLMAHWQFISTGGGSLLHYLSTNTLPVLQAFSAKQSESTTEVKRVS